MNRWVQDFDDGVCVIQKREAYFGYTAAPDDSCAALSHVELPSFALPASLVRPHSRRARAGVAELRKSSAGLNLRMIVDRRIR